MSLLERPAATILPAVLTSGCAMGLFQPVDQIRVGLGEQPRTNLPAAPYAEYYLPYAVLADTAYQDLSARRQKTCPTGDCRPSTALGTIWDGRTLTTSDFLSRIGRDGQVYHPDSANATARAILARWTFLGGYQVNASSPDLCDARPKPDGWCISITGLEVQAWGIPHHDGTNGRLALVFRGSDRSVGDWFTNLRWFTGLLPFVYDQYDQVRDHVGEWLDQALEQYRRTFPSAPPEPEIIAVGHSLGGGLAQHAAYVSSHIKQVIAFDPSPVTGYYDIFSNLRKENSTGLNIDRVYEHGEFLAYVRLFMRELYPISGRNPAILHVRFNSAKGDIFSQHSLGAMIDGYMSLAPAVDPDRPGPRPKPSNPALSDR